MSRDFIGSVQGRSFRQSPNRDRIARGTQPYPFYSSIRYISTRWGGFEWCLGGVGAPTVFPMSGTRYRRVRILHEWDAQGAVPAGRREDLAEYGEGLSDPVVSVVVADSPFGNVYPFTLNVVDVSATATERRQLLGLISSSLGFVGGMRRTITLEDPEPEFAETFKALSYVEFSEMVAFQHRTRFIDHVGDEIFDDRAFWSRGPLTWDTEDDSELPGVRRVKAFLKSPDMESIGVSYPLVHYPAADKHFVELGLGSTIFAAIPQPPPSGAVARLAARGCPAVSTTVTNPPATPAGGIAVEGRLAVGGFMWQIDLTKVNLQTGTANLETYAENIGAPVVPLTVFDISQQTLPGGILTPPAKEIVAFYGTNNFQTGGGGQQVFYYTRIAIPPYDQV